MREALVRASTDTCDAEAEDDGEEVSVAADRKNSIMC